MSVPHLRKKKSATRFWGRRVAFQPAAPPQHGFTLVEMLITVAVLATIAAITIPIFFASTDEQKIDVAAQEVANGLRFARSEALRTGNIYRFELPAGIAPKLRVYRLNSAYAEDTANPVFDPVSKKAYDISFSDSSFTQLVQVTGQPLIAVPVSTVNFGYPNCGVGAPLHIGIFNAQNCYAVGFSTFTLRLNKLSRNITFDPVTGRVVVN